MSNEIIYTLKEYKERYSEILRHYLMGYVDYEEQNFIKSEIDKYKVYLENVNLVDAGTYSDNYAPFSVVRGENMIDEILIKIKKDVKDYKGNDSEHIYYEHVLCDKLHISFTRIISFLDQRKQELETEQTSKNTLQWIGTQTEFVELTKALILNGSIKGTGNQEHTINQLANVLNFKINNPYKLLSDIKTTRNTGSETLFLDKLKKTLLDYITVEKKK